MKIEGINTIEEYLNALPFERRNILESVRNIILKNLPEGFQEEFVFGMIGYVIPLERYPVTYNKKPLIMAAIASQNFFSLYLMTIYSDKDIEKWFIEEYKKSGKKLNIGKSCIHFKKPDDLPLDLIGKLISRVSVEDYIKRYEMTKKIK